MTTARTLHEATIARLKTIPTVGVYDDDPGTNLPADAAGRVLPYVIVWPAVGYRPEAARSIAVAPGPELEWPMQTTIASGDRLWTLDAIGLVRAKLEGHVLVPGAGPLLEEPGQAEIQPDRDTSPPRHYAALMWRCLSA